MATAVDAPATLARLDNASNSASHAELPLHIEHPSSNPCTTPDELCPRNEAGEKVSIHGLSYYKNFLSGDEQAHILEAIYEQPLQQIIARRQQFYGEVYYHTSHKNRLLQPTKGSKQNDNDTSPISLPIETLLPHLQDKCQPFFGENEGFPSQLLVNEYRNNLGIASHFEDFTSFGPIILTVSLRNPIYMTLKKPKLRTNGCEEYHDIQKILLEPGSLLVLEGDARYDYRHGIAKYKWIKGLGEEYGTDGVMCRGEDYRRVSVTIRHLLKTRRKVVETECEAEERKYEFDEDDTSGAVSKRFFPKAQPP